MAFTLSIIQRKRCLGIRPPIGTIVQGASSPRFVRVLHMHGLHLIHTTVVPENTIEERHKALRKSSNTYPAAASDYPLLPLLSIQTASGYSYFQRQLTPLENYSRLTQEWSSHTTNPELHFKLLETLRKFTGPCMESFAKHHQEYSYSETANRKSARCTFKDD